MMGSVTTWSMTVFVWECVLNARTFSLSVCELINKPVYEMNPQCVQTTYQLTGSGGGRRELSRVWLLKILFMQALKLKSRNCTKPGRYFFFNVSIFFLSKPYCQMWRLGQYCALLVCNISLWYRFIFSVLVCIEIGWLECRTEVHIRFGVETRLQEQKISDKCFTAQPHNTQVL